MSEPISWALMFDTIHTAHAIIDDNKRKSLIKKMKRLLSKNKKIILFGISGTGKSQFINSLGKSLETPIRTQTTDKIKYELNEFPIVFLDTPGHSLHSFARSNEIKNLIKNGCEGIINVVCSGYEENPHSNNLEIFNQNGSVKESFINLNRNQEIDRLGEWLQHVHPDNVKWIINLVSKADVWWEKKEEVNEYYENGLYSKAFNSISAHCNVLTIPYCSTIKPFYDKKPIGLFSENHKEKMMNNFLHQLSNLLQGEE